MDHRRNRFLATLRPAERRGLLALMEPVRPAIRDVLYEQGGRITHLYFPEGCVCSLVTELADGSAVEVGMVGHEGMLGLPAVLGATSSPQRVICQITGPALRLSVAALRREVPPGHPLRTNLERYAVALLMQFAQSVACQRFHSAAERLAGWLLAMHDRAGTDVVPVTQQMIAEMLGVRRATVSELASAFQKAGLLHYHHGRLTIDDRAALERIACECYVAKRAQFATTLGGLWNARRQ